MKTVSCCATTLLVVLVGGTYLDWGDCWYWTWGVCSSLLSLPIYYLLLMDSESESAENIPPPEPVADLGEAVFDARENLIRGASLGFCSGLGHVGYLSLVFWVLQQTPLSNEAYYDRDRAVLEARLSTLEQAGNYKQAANLISDRLQTPLTATWKQALRERFYQNLLHHSRLLPANEALAILSQAAELGQELGVDATALQALQTQASSDATLQNRLEKFAEEQNWAAMTQVLKAELLRKPTTHTAQQLYDAICKAAMHAPSSAEQERGYQQAWELAVEYEVAGDRAQAALSQLQAAHQFQNQHSEHLDQLAQAAHADHRQFLSAMAEVAASISAPEKRLQEWKRILKLAQSHQVAVPQLETQIKTLEANLKKQDGLLEELQSLHSEQVIARLAPIIHEIPPQEWICPWAEYAHKAQRIISMRQEKKFAELAEWLETIIMEPRTAWGIAYDLELYTSLDRAALAEAQLAQRIILYRQAAEICSKFNLPYLAEARAKVAEIERHLREITAAESLLMAPCQLPPGANAGMGKIAYQWPFVCVDVWVEDENKSPLTQLKSKDFAAHLTGQQIPFMLAKVSAEQVPVKMAVVVDVSGSVAPALAQVQAGIQQLAEQICLNENAEIKLIPFQATVDSRQPWTRNLNTIVGAVKALKAEGGTALNRALLTAVEALASQHPASNRCLLVFTDGKDSEGGMAIEDIIYRCQASNISIYVVGLKTAELDTHVLHRITEPNGQYYESANTKELADQFRKTANSLKKHH